EQRRADATAGPADVEVVVHRLALGQDDEAADASLVPDPAFRLRQLPAEPLPMLVEGVQHRQEVERRERALVEAGEWLAVVRGRAPDHRRRLRACASATSPSARRASTRAAATRGRRASATG